jgi:hypothetical protein
MKLRILGVGVSCLVAAGVIAGCTVTANVTAGPPTINGCNADSTLNCSGGGFGYSCTTGNNPEQEDTSLSCSVPAAQPDGTDGYCCFTWSYGTSSCTPDDALTSQCPDPDSYGYQCAAGDDPSTLDSSLVCSTGVPDGSSTDFCCTYGGGSSSSGSTGGACAVDSSLACDPGSDGISCPAGGDNPEADFPGYICSAPSPQADGSDGFCCATGFTSSTCTQDASVSGCVYPSVGFSCSGTDTPDQADPSLNCSSATIDPNTGDSLYCCE